MDNRSINTFLNDYINKLMIYQNIGVTPDLQNLFSKEEYLKMLKPVVELIINNKDASIDELRKKLYKTSGVIEGIKNMVNEGYSTGIEVKLSTPKYSQKIIAGNKQEYIRNENGVFVPAMEKMEGDTIFDLASVTKLFTSLAIMSLVENENSFSLDDKITKYAPQFKNLSNVSVFDLLSFKIPLITNGRLDDANIDFEEAERRLFNIEINNKEMKENPNFRPYTDMGAMVLKYVVEGATGVSLYDYIKDKFLDKLDMQDTHIIIPDNKINRTVNSNYAATLNSSNEVIISEESPKGVVYDEKARKFKQSEGNMSGHAGLFSTADDMDNLGRGLIDGKAISSELRDEMAKNRTGYPLDSSMTKFRNYLGYLVYSKHPQSTGELWAPVSGKSLASAGWTGTYLGVDPLNGTSLFIGGDKSHARFVQVSDLPGINAPDGTFLVNTSKYAWVKDDRITRPCTSLLIQYKMLEDFYGRIENLSVASTVDNISTISPNSRNK